VKVRQISSALISGQQSEFECISNGSRPAAELQLFKGGKPLDTSNTTPEVKDGKSVLRTTAILATADHQKTLTCQAMNPKLQKSDQVLEHSLQLDVQCKFKKTLLSYANLPPRPAKSDFNPPRSFFRST
jgi:hypothetical protein